MSRQQQNANFREPGAVSLGHRFAQELQHIILVSLSPMIASRLTELFGAVAPNATLVNTRLNRLEPPRTSPRGTLMVLPDQSAEGGGVVALRNMRSIGVDTPTLLLAVDDDFQCPRDIDLLGDLDVLPLAELSRFSLRRSLIVLGARLDSQKLLTDVAGRLRSYESALADKDTERSQALNVAKALEKRLSVVENELRQSESTWADRVAKADGRVEELELRLAELTAVNPGGSTLQATDPQAANSQVSEEAAAQARQQRELATELAFHRDERHRQDATISELRQICAKQEHELHRMAFQRQQITELTAKLDASDQSRNQQTQEILAGQQRISELEENLAAIAALLGTEPQAARANPGALLQKLASRLMRIERQWSEPRARVTSMSTS